MPHTHPAVQLLLFSGLAIFWLIPLSSWLMLKGQRDALANLWFFGTGMYSVVVTLFVFTPIIHPWIGGPLSAACVFASVLIMLEALRREISTRPSPLMTHVAAAIAMLAFLTWTWILDLYENYGRAVFYLLVAITEIYLIVVANKVRRQHHSTALWVLIVTFIAFAATNLARVAEWWIVGRYPSLLEFTGVGSYALTVNYLSAIFYCYGYWGFVVEKNRTQLVIATEEAVLSREGEKMALEREHMAQEVLRERTELMSRLAVVGKYAQSGALSASIAHELNQPLAAIQLNIEESQRLAEEFQITSSLQSLLGRIKQDNQRAALIVRRVRDMFRQVPVQREQLVLDDVVRLVTEWTHKRLDSAQVRLDLHLNAKIPIQFGAGEIEHILINLLDNALEALKQVPGGQGQITLRTWIETGWVCLAVSDNGPGVPEHLKGSLFDLSQSSKPDGMGLGLWLARYLVERHGGKLQSIVTPSGGACFELRVPLT